MASRNLTPIAELQQRCNELAGALGVNQREMPTVGAMYEDWDECWKRLIEQVGCVVSSCE